MTNGEAATPGSDIPSTVELLGNIMRAFADHSIMLESTARAYSANIDGLNHAAQAQYRAMDVTEKHRDALKSEVRSLRETIAMLADMMNDALRLLDDPSSDQYENNVNNLKIRWSKMDIIHMYPSAQEDVSHTPEI